MVANIKPTSTTTPYLLGINIIVKSYMVELSCLPRYLPKMECGLLKYDRDDLYNLHTMLPTVPSNPENAEIKFVMA